MVYRLSVMGTRVEPIAPPRVAPPCPAADTRGCTGSMVSIDSPQTVTVPGTGQVLERLRCTDCRESSWYERHLAYAPMPPDLEP